MSLDVANYWQSAALTPMGLIEYWKDEVLLFQTTQACVDLEHGDSGNVAASNGHACVTTHRVIWVDYQEKRAWYLGLETVEKAEVKSSLLRSVFYSPTVILHLHPPATLTYLKQQYLSSLNNIPHSLTSSSSSPHHHTPPPLPPPPKSTLGRASKLIFKGEASHHTFQAHFNQAIASDLFRRAFLSHSSPTQSSSSAAASSASSLLPSAAIPGSGTDVAFKTTGAGIGGIVREVKKREREIDLTLDKAFTDLEALMANAKAVVDLAAKLKATMGSASSSEFDALVSDMGIVNPVTRSTSGNAEFHRQLAKEMIDFLNKRMKMSGQQIAASSSTPSSSPHSSSSSSSSTTSSTGGAGSTGSAAHFGKGGMILLTDVYCLYNRARGTQLISPQDCLTAALLFPHFTQAFKLQEYSSGVKVIVMEGANHYVGQQIKKELEEETTIRKTKMAQLQQSYEPYRDAPSISALHLSNRWQVSIVLAKQYLEVAEQQNLLWRDESNQGLQFFLNPLTNAL